MTQQLRRGSASSSCERLEMTFVLSNVAVCCTSEMGNHGQFAEHISDEIHEHVMNLKIVRASEVQSSNRAGPCSISR
jgi:hypothetical protein